MPFLPEPGRPTPPLARASRWPIPALALVAALAGLGALAPAPAGSLAAIAAAIAAALISRRR